MSADTALAAYMGYKAYQYEYDWAHMVRECRHDHEQRMVGQRVRTWAERHGH